MKKSLLLTAVLIAIVLLSSCETMLYESDIGTFQQVAEFNGQNEDELYTKARSWFVEAFVSSEAVIEQQDANSHIIKGKYSTKMARNLMCDLIYESIITIEIKDGRARFTVSAPVSSYSQVGYDRTSTNGYTPKEVERINKERQTLYNSFKAYMQSEKEDW